MFVSLLSQFLLLLSPFPSKTGCRKACEPEPSAEWAVGTNRWLSPGSRTGSPSRPLWAWTCLPLIPILASSAFLALIPATRETSLVWRATRQPRSGTPPSCRLKVTTQPVSFRNPIPTYTPPPLLWHTRRLEPPGQGTVAPSFVLSLVVLISVLHFACPVCMGKNIHFHNGTVKVSNLFFFCTARRLLNRHYRILKEL